VIDGATALTTTVPVGSNPLAIGVNPLTNRIYVANAAIGSGTVTVIDGDTNGTTNILSGFSPWAVAVNTVTNRVYVANNGGDTVTVIDGANVTTTIPVGKAPFAVAVNPATNRAYTANSGSNDVTVILPSPLQANPLTAAIAPFPGNVISAMTPTFNFSAASAFSPTAPAVQHVYYAADALTGNWLRAAPAGAAASGAAGPLQTGQHIAYAFATDTQDTTSIHTGLINSAILGRMSAYLFVVNPNAPPTISAIADVTTTSGTQTAPLAFTVSDTETPVASLTLAGHSSDQTLVPDANITFGGSSTNRTVSVTPAVGQSGSATITVTVSDGSGGTADSQFTLMVLPGFRLYLPLVLR
jgi:YVTN family beta-propeller protein